MSERTDLYPDPAGTPRDELAKATRTRAAFLHAAQPPVPVRNRDLDLPSAVATYSKGLPHDRFGLVDLDAMDELIRFLNQARSNGGFRYADPDGARVWLGPRLAEGALPAGRPAKAPYLDSFITNEKGKVRRLESPLAGHVYDLEGPDAGALDMPPAPAFGSAELAAEMAEVYALALLRDVPFKKISESGSPGADVLTALRKVGWFTRTASGREELRRRARLKNGSLHPSVLFRGSTPGAQEGPYISQFLLVGSAGRANGPMDGAVDKARGASGARFSPGPLVPLSMREGFGGEDDKNVAPVYAQHGLIQYGAQFVCQRIRAHKKRVDYMQSWQDWIDVQNGLVINNDQFEDDARFLTTPRDLATYVHYDALYQAYLNACLILLSYRYPTDSGLPEPLRPGTSPRGAFATFGDPHILTLVTEVATRALKAVRRQKFNIHLRARPEAIAGALALAASDDHGQLDPESLRFAQRLIEELGGQEEGSILKLVADRNLEEQGEPHADDFIKPDCNYLLPMAFPEGSPMHPSYGAGHATVAGACVTVLKAFFEMFEDGPGDSRWRPRGMRRLYGDTKKERDRHLGPGPADRSGIFEPEEGGKKLVELQTGAVLTLQGELDKLAANISIGRDMAGVHYYTDYYESLRMGERVAVGLLREQMLTYPEAVSMRFISFDGLRVTIAGDGNGRSATVKLQDSDGAAVDYDTWFAGY